MQNVFNKISGLTLLLSLLLFGFPSFAQDSVRVRNTDLLKEFAVSQSHAPAPAQFMKPGKGVLKQLNPIAWTLGGLMFTYQRLISPQLPSDCLYDHHCSAFSKELIADYGLLKGVLLTSDRLCRCNRVSAADVHPLEINPDTQKVAEDTEVYKRNKKRTRKSERKAY